MDKYIKKVPVPTDLDTPLEKSRAIQSLYRQVLTVMDEVEKGGGDRDIEPITNNDIDNLIKL